ncbi:MAG: TfoX/Sxy family protein [Rhodoferax sp.]|nr:TfoX/Sxy family protein [Rhodoferax sp.]
MKHTDDLVQRTRAAFEHVPNVSEKRMFGSIGFMVEGKLCVSARKDRIMCRIAPADHGVALKERGCRTVVMKGRDCPGYVYVDVGVLDGDATLAHWVAMALQHNRELVGRALGTCSK